MNLIRDGAPTATHILFFAHGAGAPMDSDFMNTIAAKISGRHIEVVRFEFPYMAARRIDGKKRPPDRPQKLLAHFAHVVSYAARPGAKLFIGGKSMGGRMATQLAAEKTIAAKGIICLGYPFHAQGKPENVRLDHLTNVGCPMLFIQGTRDALGCLKDVAGYDLPAAVRMHWLEDGDHDLKPRIKSGLTHQQHLIEAASIARSFVTSICRP